MLESSKYNVIWKSISEPNILTHSDCEYASFLKNLERICNKSGCLDSKLYTQQFKSKKSKNKEIVFDKRSNMHTYEVARNQDKFADDYEKQMKRISQALLDQKRKERILRRAKDDIIKKEYELNRSLYVLNTDISSKKFQQDLELKKNDEDLNNMNKKYYYDKSKMARNRMKESMVNQIEKMAKSRQSTLNVSKLLRQFNAKKNELDANAREIEKMVRDFEIKLERKENKHRILQDEAEIFSQGLKREKLKYQAQQEQLEKEELHLLKLKNNEDVQAEEKLSMKLNQSHDGIKACLAEQRNLDNQRSIYSSHHQVKTCEYHGSLNSVRKNLRDCEDNQNQLIEKGNYLNLVLKKGEMNRKLESTNSRKWDRILSNQQDLINARLDKDKKYGQLAKNRQAQLDFEEESDNSNHLKNIIGKETENERRIYKNMTDTGKEIKQMSMSISRAEKQLHDIKASNCSRIYEDTRLSDKQERELEDELNRRRTKLLELQAKRNNYSVQLIDCRKYLRDDAYHLTKCDGKRNRLSQIIENTNENHSVLPT